MTVRLLRLAGITLVTADLARLARFYIELLGFLPDGPTDAIPPDEIALLGLASGGRRQRLTLGEQSVTLEAFDAAAAPYPPEGDASALWFQHMALVVTDIAAAHDRLGPASKTGATPISTAGPRRLPPASGGATAYKFHDPDGHPLELLQFAPGAAPAHWHGRMPTGRQIAVGVDHSAISVSDVEASVAFYGALGLSPGKRTLNHGIEQQQLDGLADAMVDVVPLEPAEPTPHLELLGYRPPGSRGPLRRPNDIAATRLIWQGDAPALFADPDGHLHQIVTL